MMIVMMIVIMIVMMIVIRIVIMIVIIIVIMTMVLPLMASASTCALRWSCASIPPSKSSNATNPAAASIPDWRIPPPNAFLNLLALAMKSLLPTSNDPTGAPNPFDKHTEIES